MCQVLQIFSILIIVYSQFSQAYASDDQHDNNIPTHNKEDNHETVTVTHGFHKYKDDHRVVQLLSFERNITLYLEPADGHLAGDRTPVYKAYSPRWEKMGIQYQQLFNAVRKSASFFHDHDNLAALSIRHDANGNPLIHGTIGDLAIYPVPENNRIKRSTRKKYYRCDNCSDYNDIDQTHDHVVYNIKLADISQLGNKSLETISNVTLNPTPSELNDVPEAIYPQLLIVVETSLFEVFKRNVEDTIEYILSFWNAVDLRYRVFLDPVVRISIAGIILAEDSGVTPYIKNNFVEIEGYNKNKLIFNTGVLDYKSRYFYNETYHYEKNEFLWFNKLRIEYDAIITMTAYDLCDFDKKCINSGRYDCIDENRAVSMYCQTLGIAFTEGACAYNNTEKKMEAIGIIEDRGNFLGILSTAHEVGHLLGASHSPLSKYECDINDGYIMSYRQTISDKFFKWSNCSVHSIKSFLHNEKRARCMFNKPYVGSPVPRLLPGQVFTRDELCQRINGNKSCDGTSLDNSCIVLYCLTDVGQCIGNIDGVVPEGTSCGKDKYCINSECINIFENNVKLEIGTTPEYDDEYDYW